jgi:hypothetical protein
MCTVKLRCVGYYYWGCLDPEKSSVRNPVESWANNRIANDDRWQCAHLSLTDK